MKIEFTFLFNYSALPNHDPLIQGIQTVYTMGDFVAANCTSDASHPPASLTWFINDEKVGFLIKITLTFKQ